LVVGLEDGLIPSLDPFDFQAEMAPLPNVLIDFEDFMRGSSVVQFHATVLDGVRQEFNKDNTRWVSVVCNQPINNLNDDIRKQVEDEFRNRFAEWLKESRKNVFGKIQKANEQVLGQEENTPLEEVILILILLTLIRNLKRIRQSIFIGVISIQLTMKNDATNCATIIIKN
jgi:hypothetical protein